MKILIGVAAAVVLALAVCVPLVAGEGESTKLALQGLDAIALLDGEDVEGLDRLGVEHGGLLYLFANDENKKRFESDPERFGIQGDGSCPVVPSATADPGIFVVHDDHIYTFASSNCIEEFKADPDAYLGDPAAKKSGERNVAVFLYDGVELLDFSGPGEVFAATEGFNVYTVAATADSVVSQGFLRVIPEYTIANSPKPDILILPGGATGGPLRDEKVIEWIRAAADDLEVALSVCTGAFLLAKAGLLEGLQATTWHGAIDNFREFAPHTTVLEDTRWVDNGKMVTTAGVSAGIDGALHVVARLKGEQVAARTARYMEYDKWVPEQGTVVQVAKN